MDLEIVLSVWVLIVVGIIIVKVGQYVVVVLSMFGVVLVLLVVLVLIVGLGWVFRCMLGSGFCFVEGLCVVVSLIVGVKECVVVVEVNGEQLLFGVIVGGINVLYCLFELLLMFVLVWLLDFKYLLNFVQML